VRQFLVLLKKELRELLTPQVLIPIAATMILLVSIGKIAGRERQSAPAAVKLVVADLDGSALSRGILDELREAGRPVVLIEAEHEQQAQRQADRDGHAALIVIPKGFERDLLAGKEQKLPIYTFLRGFTLGAALKTLRVGRDFASLDQAVSRRLIKRAAANADPAFLRHPLAQRESIVVDGRQANVSLSAVIGVIQSQTLLVPMVMLMVIIIAAQMVATAVANEKENKTFETLLSLPIERDAIIYSKLGAAAIVALLFAGFYMAGLRVYFAEVVGELSSRGEALETVQALAGLGLVLGPGGLLLLGTSLFLGILCALSIAMILGLLADDVKSVQVVTLPLIMLVIIPYMLTMMTDLSAASPTLRWIILAIPFSHPFLAGANMMAGRSFAVLCGIVYQAAVFLFFVALASRIFASDAVFSFHLFRRRPRD
jgi:ABC-2 type transport system permease protein